MFRVSLPLSFGAWLGYGKKIHAANVRRSAPKRMIRVGETMYRVQNYKLAFQRFFGKKITPEEDAARKRREFEARKSAEYKKLGKMSSHPEQPVDHESKAGYIAWKAKAAWYGKKITKPRAPVG
ncbi:unnamed protein product [Amoebophrya sp. A25]|nr:unnamed protein product [Amoebophrya sp. A25]|eukprot:GSA25T00021690001.1